MLRRPKALCEVLARLVACALLVGLFLAAVPTFAHDEGWPHAHVFALRSPPLEANPVMPDRFTCQDADISPALSWHDPPELTKSFVLIMEDPDAPGETWVHWVVYNLPSGARELPEGVAVEPELADGTLQGANDFGGIGYGGPCPPPGALHRYVFRLYALDAVLPLPAGATKAQVLQAMTGHATDRAELIGRYQR